MVHYKLAHETIFLKPSLIGSINDKMFILTNQLVILICQIQRCCASSKLLYYIFSGGNLQDINYQKCMVLMMLSFVTNVGNFSTM